MRRSDLGFPLAAALLAFGCSSTTGSCGYVEPIEGGFTGKKTANSAVVRIAPKGFQFINSNWQNLVTAVMPAAQPNPAKQLEVPFEVPCVAVPDVPVAGTILLCDNGQGVDKVGYMDGVCDSKDKPCPLLLTIESVALKPTSPDKVGVEAVIRLDALRDIKTRATSDIALDTKDKKWCPVWPWEKRLGCAINFFSAGRGEKDNEDVKVLLKFALDGNWEKQLTFDMVAPDANNPDELIGGLDALESEDLEVKPVKECHAPGCANGQDEDMCDYLCSVVNWGWVKGIIIDQVVKPQLQGAIKSALATQRCRPCNPKDPLVPKCPGEGVDSFCKCPDGAGSCDDATKICMSAAHRGGQCVPRLLGFEGSLAVGTLMQSFGGDPAAKVELFAAAGGCDVDTDPSCAKSLQITSAPNPEALQVGMMAGAKAPAVSACVLPPKDDPAPAPRSAPPPDLAGEGPSEHHVGLAVSEYFLNLSVWEAHKAGAACISIGPPATNALGSLMGTAFPSLGVATGVDPMLLPMMVAVRPLHAPKLHVGLGTFDKVTKKPIEALLTLEMSDVRIEIFALIEDRYVRLFTVAADVKMPLSLITEGCPLTVLPALGDLKSMVTIRKDVPTNSEILAEDPAAIAQLIPTVLGMAEPAMASLLQPFAIPDMNGFRLKVNELKGVSKIGAGPDYHYLGAFAELKLAGQCESWGPQTRARLASSRIPSAAEVAAAIQSGAQLPWPQALIEASAEDLPGEDREMEYSWRVNGGLWSTWFPGGQLDISHPVFLLQGVHKIEIRARVAGEEAMFDPTPEVVDFRVDWSAPAVALSTDEESGRLRVDARDNVSPEGALAFAYRLGGESRASDFGPARPIDLGAVAEAGGLEVLVRDEAGNVGTATWRPQASLARMSAADEPGAPEGEAASGCSSAGAGLGGLSVLGLLPWALRRRRARA